MLTLAENKKYRTVVYIDCHVRVLFFLLNLRFTLFLLTCE